MKTLVITGSSRGIGLGLARAFLARGQRVVVSGSTAQSTAQAIEELGRSAADRVHGQACDVRDHAQVEALWQSAKQRFGSVDVWINNAGVSNLTQPLWEVAPDELAAMMDVNVVGTMYGCRVAIRGMLEQGHGHVYNMEGLGSDGRKMAGRVPYGASKYAVRYLTEALQKDVAGTPVKVSAISPGIVVTDFILKQARTGDPNQWAQSRKVLNILADQPERVTPWLAERVLQNQHGGALIAWLTQGRIMRRFMFAPLRKRDLFSQHGA